MRVTHVRKPLANFPFEKSGFVVLSAPSHEPLWTGQWLNGPQIQICCARKPLGCVYCEKPCSDVSSCHPWPDRNERLEANKLFSHVTLPRCGGIGDQGQSEVQGQKIQRLSAKLRLDSESARKLTQVRYFIIKLSQIFFFSRKWLSS